MDIPTGMSVTDAKALIVNADQNIFNGKAVRNIKPVWKQCRTCYVKYSPNQPECPKCATSQQKDLNHKLKWERRKELLYTLGFCAMGLSIIGMCAYSIMKFLYWLL